MGCPKVLGKEMEQIKTPFGKICFLKQIDGFIFGPFRDEFYLVSISKMGLKDFLKFVSDNITKKIKKENGISNKIIVLKIEPLKDGKFSNEKFYVYFNGDVLRKIDYEIDYDEIRIFFEDEKEYSKRYKEFINILRYILLNIYLV